MYKTIKVSLIISGFLFTSFVLADSNSTQDAINNVQSQVQNLKTGFTAKINEDNKANNAKIAGLENVIQAQFNQMNKRIQKIQKVQTSLTAQIKSVQKEAQQSK